MASFNYAIRDGARLVFRHWGLSCLTLFTSMAVFYLIGASVLFVLNARYVVGVLEGELSIQAYLEKTQDLQEVAEKVRRLPHVKVVKIITPEIALDRLKLRLGKQAEAVTLLGENPLPPSLEIWVDSASSVAPTAEELETLPEVQDVVYAGKLAERLSKLSRFAGHFSVAVLIVAITASGIVLFNTIRIAVYAKENEISIMLMVGATPTFVALPFVVQGIFLGAMGALIAAVLLSFSYGSVLSRLHDLLPFLPLLGESMIVFKLGVVLVGAGATVSLLASLMAVERYIRRSLRPL